jgi:hypothetical protein
LEVWTQILLIKQVNLGSLDVGIAFMQCIFEGIMEVLWLPHMDQEEIM